MDSKVEVPEDPVLIVRGLAGVTRALREFGVKLRDSGRESYGGQKDDLVIALCLAVWAAELGEVGPRNVPLPGVGTGPLV